jgi:putative peptidoglycan lipid II flippase
MSADMGTRKTSESTPEDRQPTTGASQSLLQSTSVVSAMTFLSRISGLLRDIVLARFFGASLIMDAFIVANRIPNMLRRFFAEGAFSQGFVPVMARYREKHDADEAREFVDAVAGTLGLILFGVTLAGVLLAPVLVAMVAPGFIGSDGRFDMATLMLRFTFPYLLFISLTAFAGGVLNTYGKFAAAAFTPVLLNLSLIAAAIWLAPMLDEPGMALAYGVFIAGVVQLLFQIPFLAKIHLVPRPRWNWRHAGVRRAGKLMLPAIFGSSIAQINVLIGGIIASLLGVGKISLLYFSDRLMEFPLGLFSIALATVILPHLSRQHASKSVGEFAETVAWSMMLVSLIAVPAAVGLIVMAEPLVTTIFYGGEFTRSDVEMTVLSLQAFSIGLIGFSFVKILAPAFFAREDTRTPVKIGLIALAVNFVLSIGFAIWLTRIEYPATHAGLALAISIAALVNAVLLYRGLQRDGVIIKSAAWLQMLPKIAIACLVMTVCIVQIRQPLDWWLDASVLVRSGWLAMCIGVGSAAYCVVLLILGVRPSHFVLHER